MQTKEERRETEAAGLVTSRHLCDVANITYRQADHWTRTGILHCNEGHGVIGSGVTRTYPPLEVQVAHLLGQLSRAGLSPSSRLAQRAVEHVRNGDSGMVCDGPLAIFVVSENE